MNNHPKRKEELTKKRSPSLIPTVERVKDTRDHSHKVYDEQSRRWDQKRCPFDQVKLGCVAIFVRGFRCDCEVGVYTGEHFEKTLDYCKQVSWNTTNDPKLLVSPPLVYTHSTPSHFQYTRGENQKEEWKKPYACQVTYLQTFSHHLLRSLRYELTFKDKEGANLRDDEFVCEETNGR